MIMFELDHGEPSETEGKVVSGAFSSKPESSFDSGYSTSPAKFNFGVTTASNISYTQSVSSMMDPQKHFIASPLRSHSTDSNQGILSMSPVKIEAGLFSPFKGSPLSPFKDSSLSPFKLLNQSPSKGSFDDWDKDFIASFQENLFGDVTASSNLVDEWLRSPQGKALLESRNSPMRTGGNAVRRLKISPENKNRKQNFQPLHDNNVEIFSAPVYIKQEPTDNCFVKEENTSHDHMYGQSTRSIATNPLSAIDPNKMSDTPMKPRVTNMENAPIRKLSMRMSGVTGDVPTVIVQRENLAENYWPSKEKLKFARLQFKQILNKAVEKELEILQKIRERKAEANEKKISKKAKNAKCDSKLVVHAGGNMTKVGHKHGGKMSVSGKVSQGGKSKGKVGRKGGRKDRYPQIKMALSKPVKQEEMSPLVHRELFPPGGFTDPCWYPSDEEIDVEDEDDTWSGPPPVFKQSSVEDYGGNDETSDEDFNPTTYQYETLSGRKVKKRKIYRY